MKLTRKIEELIYQNASDFEVSKAIKEEIKEYLNSLEIIFDTNQGKDFLVKHTKNIDSIIKATYKYTLRVFFQDFTPLSNTIPISLVALGSYGREQLCVYSDIDIMIVYKDVSGYNLEAIIEKFLQILWDSGLKLGHRVHKLDELIEASKSDQTIKTAIIESRFIYGSKQLFFSIENYISKIQKDSQKEFILAKLDEYKKRRKTHPFSMEPNIKSSPGGLRDFNTIYWISKTIYNIPQIKHLPSTIITENEYNELLKSVEFLYRVRSAMHLTSGKKQDKLILEYLPDIARKLNLEERKLIRKTFSAMHKIRNISAFVIKKLTKKYLFKTTNISVLKNSYISNRKYICSDKLYTTLKNRPEEFEELLKSLFSLIDSNDIKYDISFIYRLSNSKKRVEDKSILKELFSKRYIYHTLIALYNSDILSVVMPPFRKIKHLEQFDGYHKYPVDIHSLQSVKALENIDEKNIKTLYDSLDKRDKTILKFATLFHDCGKGRKKDHSILGANIAKKFALEIGFTNAEAGIVYTLIKNHTRMSNTASREDIYSDKVVLNFLSHIKTEKILTMLYILTYADIESVEKGTYSNLNANLMHELYTISLEAIKNNQKVITEAKRRAKEEVRLKKESSFLKLSRLLQKQILSLESNLLFFKYSPQEIIDISLWVNKLKSSRDYKIDNSENLIIEIIRKDEFNLGYFLSKLSHLNVLNMDIFKFFHDVKYFKIEFLDEVKEQMDLVMIKKYIEESFDMGLKPKLPPLYINKNQITIDCNHSRSYASFKLNTVDQKGLLANILSIFDDIGIDIASAKIQTIKRRARNLFLIEKNGNFCKNKERIVERLCVE